MSNKTNAGTLKASALAEGMSHIKMCMSNVDHTVRLSGSPDGYKVTKRSHGGGCKVLSEETFPKLVDANIEFRKIATSPKFIPAG